MLMILLSTLRVIRHLWQELELSSELESDLQDTCLGQEVASWFCLTVLTRLVLLM